MQVLRPTSCDMVVLIMYRDYSKWFPRQCGRGLMELELPVPIRVREKGAGHKCASKQKSLLKENFLKLLVEFTADDPMREGVLWTNLSRR
jgi:hypothetical protein